MFSTRLRPFLRWTAWWDLNKLLLYYRADFFFSFSLSRKNLVQLWFTKLQQTDRNLCDLGADDHQAMFYNEPEYNEIIWKSV